MWLLGLLGIATILVLHQVLGTEFINYDDDVYVTENPLILDFNMADLRGLFSTFYANQYSPVAMTIMGLEIKALGVNSVALKAVSVLLHLLNAWLVFALIKALFERFELALLTAAIFALHPLQVESVAWLAASMKIGTYSAFFLGSLLLYTKYLQSNKRGLYLYSVLLFLLSCFCKEQAVILPLILPFLDQVRTGKLIDRKRNTGESTLFCHCLCLWSRHSIRSARSGRIRIRRLLWPRPSPHVWCDDLSFLPIQVHPAD